MNGFLWFHVIGMIFALLIFNKRVRAHHGSWIVLLFGALWEIVLFFAILSSVFAAFAPGYRERLVAARKNEDAKEREWKRERGIEPDDST